MGQEDTEKEISFDCLRTRVDEAIKTKNICIIESIEVAESKLKYMQKYAELCLSKDVSLKSYILGAYGIIFLLHQWVHLIFWSLFQIIKNYGFLLQVLFI